MTDINALAVVDQQQIDSLTMTEVKKLWCPTVNDKEFGLFLGICKSFGLNPFKREIHLIKYGEKCSIVVGYEVYLKRADRTGKLDGWKVSIVDRGTPNERAVIEISRKDFKQPFIWEVAKKEAAKDQANWKTMPDFMLKKVAIGQGFRLAFPDEMGGMPYVQEEIVQDEPKEKHSFTPHQTTEVKDITPEVKDTLNVKTSTEEQVKDINNFVSLTKDPMASSKYICDKYSVDSYGQLSFEQAEAVIKQLSASVVTKSEPKQETTEEAEDPNPRAENPKTGKPITEKQLKKIVNMLEHFHERKEGKKAVLLSKVGAGSLEKCTSYQASQILKVLIEQLKKDDEARKQDVADNL